MNIKLKLLALSSVVALLITGTGCSLLFKKKVAPEPEKKIETPDTNPQEDEKAKAFIAKYFEVLYGQPTQGYSTNLITGSIPSALTEYIAKKTIDEGNNNPEIPISFPRVVEINGMSIVNFGLLSGGSGSAVNSTFIGKQGDSFLYFVKVDLNARCLPNPVFDQYYQLNANTKLYDGIAGKVPAEGDYDFIKVQAKFDVELVKDGEDYKVKAQKEANYKPILEKRISKLNNDFLIRIKFLDENVEADKTVYEAEKAIIEGLFNNLIQIDKQRMSLLKPLWQKGLQDFVGFINKAGITKVNETEILFMDDSYKNKFNIDHFPIQINMDRINSLSNISVIEHPGYSFKNKIYFVKFDASVIKSNGMIEDEEVYAYDYLVTLKKENQTLKVDSIKLNEYYKK